MSNLVSDVNAVGRGQTGFAPYDSTSNRNIPEGLVLGSDEELTLLEAGERNATLADVLREHDSVEFSGGDELDDEGEDRRLFCQMAVEQAEYKAAQAHQDKLFPVYQDEEYVPFFMHQNKRGVSQPAVQTRSEALAVAAGRSVKKGEATSRKHQQFFGNLRIH